MTGQPVVIHLGFANNIAVGIVPSGTGVSADGKTVDDSAIDRAFAAAEVVISQRMVNHRLVPCSIEPRGVVAHYEPGKELLTIWSSTQNPHILKTQVAGMFDLGEHQIRAIAPEVGGGFGSRSTFTPRNTSARASRRRWDPGQVDRGSKRSVRRHDARPRPHRLHRCGGEARWHRARPEAADRRGHWRLQHAAHCRHSDADDADGERDVPHSRDSRDAHRSVHQQDADRRVSRRRPARGHVLRRTRARHARTRAGHGSGGGAPKEFHSQRRVSLLDPDGGHVRLG